MIAYLGTIVPLLKPKLAVMFKLDELDVDRSLEGLVTLYITIDIDVEFEEMSELFILIVSPDTEQL